MVTSTFHLVAYVVNSFWGRLVYLSRTSLGILRNGFEIGTWGYQQNIYEVPLTSYSCKSFWGRLVHLSQTAL